MAARKSRIVLVSVVAVVLVAAAAAWFVVKRHAASGGGAGAFFGGHSGPARDIILVTIDTTRADALGYAGNTTVRTPFLDSLAAKGLVFTNAHAHNVITLPSHINILTGLYPYQHGVRENAGFTLDASHATVATMLRKAGYATGAFVGAFPLDARFGLNQGFDVYDDNYGKGQATVDFVVQERPASAVLAAATDWWRRNEGKKRFMWVHCYDPHAPYLPPEPYRTEFRGHPYLGEISYVDAQLSEALTPILTANPDALVIVTADHGESLGEHGERTHGLFAYEVTLKIPLLLARGGVAHRVVSDYVRHIDIVPTILDSAGVAAPKELLGRSLLRSGAATDTYFESLSTSINRGWAPLTGVIHSGLKYIQVPITELYDLQSDPHEQTNVAGDRRRDVEAARKILASLASSAPAPSRNVSSEEIARLRSLGYITGSAETKDHYTAADDPKTLVHLDSKMHDAVDAFERGQAERGLSLAREVVAERPTMSAGRELLAFMLQQNDRVAEAIEQLEVLTRDPHVSDDDRTQLALLYCETGQPKKAVALLEPHSKTDNPDLLNTYGVALSDDRQVEPARQQFERALAIDPNNAPALQNLGILALRMDDVPTARNYLGRALELNPKLPLALNTLGVVYARENDFQHAVEMWQRAVDVDPRQYDALYNIGMVAVQARNAPAARQALTRFVNTAPPSQYANDIASARRILATMPH
ncbi:MAG: sulfatase-like hydrolase/transferase [Acidobacteria bacterium]|nr:sulfatase-like hydrolase/transferase [Acidobacteriota bacterium]MBV9479070.1 sulfatase-like hydrolase/transferase [Acidobacteriota bacterium]